MWTEDVSLRAAISCVFYVSPTKTEKLHLSGHRARILSEVTQATPSKGQYITRGPNSTGQRWAIHVCC
jgi:hypothetical protein